MILDLHDQNNHDGMITHLEPDILENEAKWDLGSITQTKLEEVIEFQLTYFKSEVLLNMPANLENSAVATGLEKLSFHFNPKERQCQRMLKLPHDYNHLTC